MDNDLLSTEKDSTGESYIIFGSAMNVGNIPCNNERRANRLSMGKIVFWNL